MSLQLEILVPDGVALQAQVASVRATDASGQFGIWPGHECFLTLLVPCVLNIRDVTGHEQFAAADGGVLIVEKDHIAVVTREAVVADKLADVADAAAAMLEARQAQERQARTEFAELQASLLRELRTVEKRS